MVARLLRLARVPDPPDVADALALALCHLAARRYEDLVRSARGEGSPGPREARR